MNAQTDKTAANDFFFTDWAKAITDFWGSMAANWPQNWPMQMKPDMSVFPGRMSESWNSWLKTVQITYDLMGQTQNMDAFARLFEITPDILARFSQIGLSAFGGFQKQVQERLQRLGETVEPFDFQDLDKEALQLWTEIYEKEICQLFKIPQLGLMREYQERMLASIDKQNRFQSVLAEYLQLLYQPIENSFKALQDTIQQQAKTGQVAEDPKNYYREWIKILEAHYLTMYKSPEYTKKLDKTIGALSDYWIARREVLEDSLKSMNIPTYGEMDELYKELYEIKKELKAIKKVHRRAAASA